MAHTYNRKVALVGRSITDSTEIAMDLDYIDSWSLWLDFKILMRTFWCVVAGTGR